MAENKKNKRVKNDKGFFQSLSEKCASLAGLLVFAMLVLNFAVVYLFEKSRKPQVVYSVERVFVNTNDSSTVVATVPAGDSVPVSASSNSLPSSVFSDQRQGDVVRLSTTYEYFTHDHRRYVRMFERLFGEGSLTSYGRIVIIFPDRILLEDGSYINNSKWTSPQSASVAVSRSHD